MKLQKSVPLHGLCSYGVGGSAEWYGAPTTELELIDLVVEAHSRNLPLFFLGKGSNILISDHGISGAVVNLSGMNHAEISGTTISAEAGIALTRLVMATVNKGLAGMEQLAGIPGTLGGALLMNAGAYEQTISDSLQWVRWLDISKGTVQVSPVDTLRFGYRTSSFRDGNSVILAAGFTGTVSDGGELREIVKTIQGKRRSSQPLNYPSCGSVFKRPPGKYAGALIEAAGLKGRGCGGAEISEKHANFIVNRGGATAEDIRCCISMAQKAVFETTEILLEPEVIFVGEFNTPLFSEGAQYAD